jgi:hypothetical protein
MAIQTPISPAGSQTPSSPPSDPPRWTPAARAVRRRIAKKWWWISGIGTVVSVALAGGAASTPSYASSAKAASTTSTSLLATLANPGEQTDNFAYAVALSSTTAAVGAPGYNGNSGAAYIYVKPSTSSWPTHATAMLHDPGAYQMNDEFGWSVALSGTTLMVGAPGYHYPTSGRVFVYTKTTNGWGTTPTATLASPSPACAFGSSVSISGTIAVIGATCTNSGAGRAYIYAEIGGVWGTSPVATLVDPGALAGDDFGHSVAISGTTVVVGADDGTGSNSGPGSAYLYSEAGSSWPTTPTVTLNDPGGFQYDFFGSSVAVAGTTVAVGASGEHSAGIPAGAAYLYKKSGTGVWPSTPSTTLASPGSYSAFGYAVGVSAARAVVGATQSQGPTGETGSASVYTQSAGVWSATPSATIFGRSNLDVFGFAVSVAGSTMAVSAPSEFGSSSAVAMVRLYSL